MSRIETYTQKSKSKQVIFIGLLFSTLIVITSIVLLLYPFPSNTYEKYFKSNFPVVFRGDVDPLPAMMHDHEIYVPVSFIKEKIDPSITIDQASKSVILTTKNKVMQLPSDSLTYFVNEKPFQLESPAYINQQGIAYMSLAPFAPIFHIHLTHRLDTGALLIKKDGDTLLTGIVKETKNIDLSRLRVKPTITSSYDASVKKGEKVEIEKDVASYYFIRKENGIGGYLKKDLLTLEKPQIVAGGENQEQFKPFTVEWPINLTWEAVYTKTPNPNNLPNTPGVNIVSPTWFKLKDNFGDITNLGSEAYAKWAKTNHFKIWGLFSNDFDPKKTHEAFKDFETRQKMIRQLLAYSHIYHLNGINVDIENVDPKDGDLITQFMREATPYFHQAGLVVSMDITFISSSENWSKFYERSQLKDIVDYLIVMAYDEHWANSSTPGSVASFPWVEKNLQALLKVVPHDRLILGIPLYARIWKEKTTENGNVEVSSKAYTMSQINEWLKKNKVKTIIDKESGQYYGEYYDAKENATYKAWIENKYSLTKRAQLVYRYSLAGIATWSRYFGDDAAWSTLNQSLKKITATTSQK